MLSLVSVKRIVSDLPTSNEDRNELEIAGELSKALGGFFIPRGVVRDSHGYKTISGHFQYHAAVVARRPGPYADETIPLLSSSKPKIKRQASALLLMLKFVAPDAFAPSQQSDGAI